MRLAVGSLALAATLLATPRTGSAQTFRDQSSGSIGFGGAALIMGDLVLIGRPGTLIGFPLPASHAGAVHVFRRTGDRWTESGILSAKHGTLGDGFGTALAADGNILAVGAPGAEGGGAVYLYERGSGGRWTERARLTAAKGVLIKLWKALFRVCINRLFMGFRRSLPSIKFIIKEKALNILIGNYTQKQIDYTQNATKKKPICVAI
jgi:hypothetical protein